MALSGAIPIAAAILDSHLGSALPTYPRAVLGAFAALWATGLVLLVTGTRAAWR